MEVAIDCIVDIHDLWKLFKRKVASLFTIKTDILKVSKDPIKFRGCRDFGGYMIVGATNEHNRRIVHWFYRNIHAPTLDDWLDCLSLFNLSEIPLHILQLYNHEKEPLNKFILIHSITRGYIHYTYENKEDNKSTTVIIPLGTATLVPEKFLFNLKLHSEA